MKRISLSFLIILLSLIPCYGQVSSSLIKTTNQPDARHECGTVAFEGELVLMGGRGIKPVQYFNPKTRTWRDAKETPFEIHHFQPVVYNKEIYILSAFTGGWPRETPLENIWIYNPERDDWRKGPSIPTHRRRGGGGALVSGDKIYVAGGIVDGHHAQTVPWTDVYSPENREWEPLANMPNRRDHTVSVGDDQYMYLIGGRTTDYHEEDNYDAFLAKTIQEVDRFDLENRTWQTLSALLPIPTAGGGAVLLEGKIYYSGGETAQVQAHDEIQVYDIQAGKWSIEGHLKKGRHGSQIVLLGGQMYFASGSGNKGGGPELETIEVISINK